MTNGELTVDATAKGATSCRVGLDKSKLPAAAKTTVTVVVPSGCKADEPLKVEISTAGTGPESQAIEISPKESTETKPDWKQLWAFGIALLLAGGFVSILYLWIAMKGNNFSPVQRLGSLEATWKFNDNWATNATAVGALLTGLFSATTAKAFLGDDADSLIALATVGAGIALVFVSAAPIAALATKSYRVKNAEGDKVAGPEAFTVGGILFAATLILAGAGGQLWVTTYTITELDLGNLEWVAWGAFGFGVALLAVYAWRTLRHTIEHGSKEPETKPAVEIEAAKLIVSAIEVAQKTGADQTKAQESLEAEVEQANEFDPQPRSALI